MAIVLDSTREKILMHRRSDNEYWSLPGGAAEFGDTVQKTVCKEIQEECGISVEINRLIGVYTNPNRMIFNYADGNNIHSYSLVFECYALTDNISLGDGKETLEVGWHSPEFVVDNIWGKLRYIVKNYIENPREIHID